MRRREFIALLGAAAIGHELPAVAQQQKRLPVVGLVAGLPPVAELAGLTLSPTAGVWRGFYRGLRDFGWIDGRNLTIERRSTEGDPQRAPAIFADLISRGADVIVIGGLSWLLQEALRVPSTTPIVAHFPVDPIAAGLVASLSRPGGNMTGLTQFPGPEFHGKQLQLLQELAPAISRVAFFATRTTLDQYRDVARPVSLTIIPVAVDHPEQFEAAFAAIRNEQAQAVMVGGGPVNFEGGTRIVAFAAQSRLPAIYAYSEVAR
jgi:putative tryptophan/tyrosine transport system substrate-binding protein